MNDTISILLQRRSVRLYLDKPIEREQVQMILECAMRAPTAGNLMLYSILEINDQALKNALAVSCDDQPFIAKAPLVLVFLADYRRLMDYYLASDVADLCERTGRTLQFPEEGDLMLACCDALIAAHTAVTAAEALGIGSCYIGDILENWEYHQTLLALPQYTFPITMVCFGYPTEQEKQRKPTTRLPQDCVHFIDGYRRLDRETLLAMFGTRGQNAENFAAETENHGQSLYVRKFVVGFTQELRRSVREAIKDWTAEPIQD